MIARLNGTVIEKSSSETIIECGGVGYQVYISVQTSEKLPEINSNVLLHIHHVIREDTNDLFGFIEKSEKEAFLKLISVNKIGPKIAVGILSAIEVAELQKLIISGNHKALSKLPGIGPKTSERLVVELKDKFSDIEIEKTSTVSTEYNISQEAVSALIALGYNKMKAEKSVKAAVKETGSNEIKIEKLIKMALKYAIA